MPSWVARPASGMLAFLAASVSRLRLHASALNFMRALGRRSPGTRRAEGFLGVLVGLSVFALAAGCASTEATDPKRIAKRKAERPAAYAALPAEQQTAVDQGLIKVGMTEDAVYIAWGKPAQVLRSGSAAGEVTTWLYQSTATDTYHYWHYREYPRRDGSTYLDRALDTDYSFHDYVSAELHFREGKLDSWRMLPKPPEHTHFAPDPYFR